MFAGSVAAVLIARYIVYRKSYIIYRNGIYYFIFHFLFFWKEFDCLVQWVLIWIEKECLITNNKFP